MPVYLEFSTRAPPPFYFSTDANVSNKIWGIGVFFSVSFSYELVHILLIELKRKEQLEH